MNKKIWILLIAMVVLSLPAFGQEDNMPRYQMLRPIDDETGGGWYDVAYVDDGEYLDDPCTPTADWTWVSYNLYVAGEQTAAGLNRYQFDESTSVGGGYSASGTSFTDVTYGQDVEIRQYRKMNTYTDFHVVTVIRYNPYYQTQTVSLETACGDGSPTSLQ